jgi:imidazolonepropionase-like amidohydrolase
MQRETLSLLLAPLARLASGSLAALAPIAAIAAMATMPARPLAAAEPVRVDALTGARIVVAPGKVIEKGTVILRDGKITAVGATAVVPADARVHDLAGKTIYAAFVEPYAPAPADDGKGGLEAHPNDFVRPERRVADTPLDAAWTRRLREAGYAVALAVPTSGVLRGEAAVVGLAETDARRNVWNAAAGQVVEMQPRTGDGRDYPVSTMGAVALFRQTMLDAAWQKRTRGASSRSASGTAPADVVPALAELGPLLDGVEAVIFEADSPLDLLRAASLAKELSLRAWAVGSGSEYLHAGEIARTGWTVALPLAFPKDLKLPAQDDGVVRLEDLRHWKAAPGNARALERAGVPFVFTSYRLDDAKDVRARVRRTIAAGLTADQALAALTTGPAKLLGIDGVDGGVGTLEVGKAAHVLVADGDLFAEKTKLTDLWISGVRHPLGLPEGKAEGKGESKGGGAGGGRKPNAEAADVGGIVWKAPATPAYKALLLRGATVWTSGPQGTLPRGDVLIRDGKVEAVGASLTAPADALVVDVAGKHVTAGLIDAHSHTGVQGQVNEGTNIVTSEVRIADVLDPEDVSIYRELAGGLTVANVLHGSANAIGGQNQVIKLRWGGSPDDLLFREAAPGIKFALGENPKQSNWAPERRRYPQTRMGVEQAIHERFSAAIDYRERWKAYRAASAGSVAEPRRDLQLEALVEILDGKRLVHAHSYRHDEILMLLALADRTGFKVATLQHVLEGYKVADEIAAHGAGASTFSDWWGYKYEVFDAIPWNGAVMWKRGVVTSFNSDSDELARRLNLDAAKAVRYGGVPEDEALKFVTLNPAKQLGVDRLVGSIEPGKSADFVIWSGHPLSSATHCEQTWIEGRKYFDRADDLAQRSAIDKERVALLTEARAAAKKDADKPDKGDKPERRKGGDVLGGGGR